MRDEAKTVDERHAFAAQHGQGDGREPVMLRLKELEALEAIAGKVERLTVHNGTGGLLNDLVKLRDS